MRDSMFRNNQENHRQRRNRYAADAALVHPPGDGRAADSPPSPTFGDSSMRLTPQLFSSGLLLAAAVNLSAVTAVAQTPPPPPPTPGGAGDAPANAPPPGP